MCNAVCCLRRIITVVTISLSCFYDCCSILDDAYLRNMLSFAAVIVFHLFDLTSHSAVIDTFRLLSFKMSIRPASNDVRAHELYLKL